MCSKYEVMARVTAEEMVAPEPVIGYDNGGTAEIIENRITVLLYEGGNKNLANFRLEL